MKRLKLPMLVTINLRDHESDYVAKIDHYGLNLTCSGDSTEDALVGLTEMVLAATSSKNIAEVYAGEINEQLFFKHLCISKDTAIATYVYQYPAYVHDKFEVPRGYTTQLDIVERRTRRIARRQDQVLKSF